VQPFRVRVLLHEPARAVRLAEPKRLGQMRDALARTSQRRSAVWALWRARGQAVREDLDPRIARVRTAVQTIRPAAAPAPPALGTHLCAFASAEPVGSPEVGGALRWHTGHEAKAQRAMSTAQSRLSTVPPVRGCTGRGRCDPLHSP
jgi:hypothetical protein